MVLLWPNHSPHMVLQLCSSGILINMHRGAPCQISHCWVYFVAHFPRNGQNMALLWQNMFPSWFFKLDLSNLNCCAQGCSMSNFTLLDVSSNSLSQKRPKYGPLQPKHGPHMALLWPKHGSSNWFFLNPKQCSKGCFMLNITLLGESCSPLSQKWPK